MHWKIKSTIQKIISLFPDSLAYPVYYYVQRNFGGLKYVNPVCGLTSGINIWLSIKERGSNPQDKVFFEVGTGWVPLVPLSYYLIGSKKTISIDLIRIIMQN